MTRNQSKELFELPFILREIEKLLIIFWLIKDMNWNMDWRIRGVNMIIPTRLITK